jgi:hypothetical protein
MADGYAFLAARPGGAGTSLPVNFQSPIPNFQTLILGDWILELGI